jgi:hypothetical protein
MFFLSYRKSFDLIFQRIGARRGEVHRIFFLGSLVCLSFSTLIGR